MYNRAKPERARPKGLKQKKQTERGRENDKGTDDIHFKPQWFRGHGQNQYSGF